MKKKKERLLRVLIALGKITGSVQEVKISFVKVEIFYSFTKPSINFLNKSTFIVSRK